ncbi:DUF222 domain-containing protein [Microtetraspora malaysiensis]|uniref:HNH endonuclease signature motif containing protein n=1 Tax=Microtetraspora malaysiensis TaxID=161358 RepID=UPI003D93F268
MTKQRQPIPPGLEHLAPGAELAAVLAGIDITLLDGFDAVIVLQAYARLEAHVQARKVTVMAEVGLYEISASGMEKMPEPDKNSPDEIRAALRLTRRAAEREYGLAYDLKVRLPMVRDALEAGTIDKTRAVVFCDWLEDIPIELARAVAGHLLPNAGRWTTSELREKIKKLLIAADPGRARRRYERAVHQRRVVGVRHADGSATITGQQLPVDQAAAAIARVDAIAIRAKRTGLHAPIDHIRADVFLGLLDGSMSGLDDDGVIAVLFAAAARRKAGEEEDYDDQLSDDPSTEDPSTGDPEDSGPLDGGETGHASTPDDTSAPADTSQPQATSQPQVTSQPQAREGQGGCDPFSSDAASPAAAASVGAGNGAFGKVRAGGRTRTRTGADTQAKARAGTDGRADAGGRAEARGGGKVPAASDGSQSAPLGYAAGELRVRASTLMHLDDLPAELAGWGPIHAHLARIVAKRQIGGEWRFAVCDEDGHLLFAGVTRRRPGGWPRQTGVAQKLGVAGEAERDVRAASVRGRGIVELQFPLSLLRALHADLHALGGWAGVVADAVGQYEAAGPDHAPGEGAGDGADAGRGAGAGGADGVRSSGGAYSAPAGAVPQEAAPHDGASDSGDGRRRFPRAGLRRHIQVRDRVCTHPGCRAPATRSELDHTRPYAAGGSTSEGNLAAACAHDHDLRDNGWQVVRTGPGHVTWISRTGHRYPAQPPPVIEPLPEPFAPAGWAHLRPADSGYGAGSITDPAVDELPYAPAYRYEPARWEEPLAKPDTAQEVTVRAGPPADPAEDIPPV